MGTETIIGALVAAAAFVAGLWLILSPRTTRPEGRDFRLDAVETTRFDAPVGRLVSYKTGYDPQHVSATSHRLRGPAHLHQNLSDVAHCRRLVDDIAQRHNITLYACLKQADVSAQVDILREMMTNASLSPYIVDAGKDPAIVLGLPLADDHLASLVLYDKGGLVVGNFIAVTDALR